MRITGVQVYTVNIQKNEDHDFGPSPRGKKKKKEKKNTQNQWIIRGNMETVTVATQEPQNVFTLSDPDISW